MGVTSEEKENAYTQETRVRTAKTPTITVATRGAGTILKKTNPLKKVPRILPKDCAADIRPTA
jgi:hypothetical protein